MRKKSKSWLFFPVIVLIAALLLWLFWKDIERLARRALGKDMTEQSQKPAREGISEEDRKKLEEILRKR
ncbi:MAG: hypothetical protein HYY45_02675 [Deltaproteobacteria bacterium]|nr:hypothetical protein [Deltaproteobacteria bacterium]